MNYRQILRIFCIILRCLSVFLLLPAFVGLASGEAEAFVFFLLAGVLALLSCVSFFFRPAARAIYARDGFVVVALSWVCICIVGAVPFFATGAIPHWADALFESVSGFTTTGATVLSDVEVLPRCMLFWRSFSHWIGGMGVLMFLLAVLPLAGGRNMHLVRAETSGPSVRKTAPKMRTSALILYGIYISLTLLETVALLLCGLPLFDALAHAFSTAGTGGFSTRNGGVAAFQNPAAEIVILVFMVVFSVNFNLFFFLWIKKVGDVRKNEELRWFLFLLTAGAVCLMLNIRSLYDGFAPAFHHAAFQVASIASTTGFASADYVQWPVFSRMFLLFFMWVGGCAGSTAGGIKCARLIILVKSVRRECRRMLHPRSVNVIQYNGETLEEETVHGTVLYLLTYFCILIAALLLLSLTGTDFETVFTSALACLSNTGPGFGAVVGPMGSYAPLDAFAKVILSLLMLLGRLEIFPLLLLFLPSVWTGLRRSAPAAGKRRASA